ncbi:MAG: DUF58 domain-containing protein [Planctomycetota bacterium]
MTHRVFHEAVPRSIWQRGNGQHGFGWWMKQIALLPLRVLLAPFQFYKNLRNSMTAASVSVLLISIFSLNIIWGYPWSGMFSASIALLVVGFIINRMTRPRLELGFSLPRSTPAGQPFVVVTHARNIGWLPTMDLSIGFEQLKKRRRKKNADGFSGSKHETVSLIQTGQRIHRSASVSFDRRGIRTLPDLVVTSMYPFHLFRWTQKYASGTSIAVTPKPLDGNEDGLARSLLDSLGKWSHRLLAGDALDYTGSREYEVGMAVRRWDFASWARLGKPIVREFQSPTIQMVTLIIDTSVNEGQDSEKIERVLSLAANAINDLALKSVRVGLHVTQPQTTELAIADPSLSSTDAESLLIRLAEAESVTTEESDQQINEIVDQMRHTPLLVITSRSDVLLDVNTSSLSVLRIDSADPLPAPKLIRKDNTTRSNGASANITATVPKTVSGETKEGVA